MNKKIISLVITSTLFVSSFLSTSVFAKDFDSKSDVSLNHAWNVKFNKQLNSSQDFSNVTIKDSNGNIVPVSVVINSDNQSITVEPEQNYSSNTNYTLTVDGLKDTEGDKLSDNATMQFTTANEAQQDSFDISSVTANNNQGTATTNLDPNSSFDVELSKNVDLSTLSNIIVTDKDGNKANVKVSAVENKISIVPDNVFWDDTHTIDVPRNAYNCNTTYTINLNGVKSIDGQDIATKTYNFTTRDYELNPTIQGICNDDYISFGNQYANELYQIPYIVNGVSGYAQSIQQCHDSNGTLVLDNAYKIQKVDQITNGWNPYANLQNRNIVNLQVELRKQYQKMAKNSDYVGYNIGFRETAPDTTYGDGTGMALYQYMPNVLNSMPAYTFQLFSFYKFNINEELLQEVYGLETTTELKSILINKHPQMALQMSSINASVQGNLSRVALYQSIYAMVGGDYAGEIYDYIMQEEKLTYSQRQKIYTKQIGHVQIWDNNEVFLVKY